jgi:ParB-like chromosome segregation protein Spo0J
VRQAPSALSINPFFQENAMTLLIIICLGLVLVSVLAVAAPGGEDIPVREATAKRKPQQIPLSKLDFESDECPAMYYCHRADVNKDLDPLIDSLVREGQVENIQVWPKPKTDRFLVIAGHRRVMALRHAVEQKLDPSITDDTLLDCTVISGENRADLLVASLATNAQRQDLVPLEILAAVKKLRDEGVSNPRGAAAVGYGRTQYERFVAIVENGRLYQHVLDEDIGQTKASRLIEAIQKAQGNGATQTLDDVLRDFAAWCEERRREIEAAREKHLAARKKFPESLEKVDSYVTTDLLKQWVQRIENGERILGEASFAYGVILDEKKGKLTIPALSNLDLRAARSADLLKIVQAVVGLPRKLVPFIRQAEFQEQLQSAEAGGGAVDPDFQAFLQETGLEHRFAEFKRQAEAAREAESGEAAQESTRPARQVNDLTDNIDALMRQAGAMPPSELPQDDAEEAEA